MSNDMSIEYANAYTEVLEVLNHMSEYDYDIIPKDIIMVFQTKCNKQYKFKYDLERNFEEQNLSKRAKLILAILFRDYWATPIQKQKIIAKQEYDRVQIEKKKREIYSSDNLFKNSTKKKSVEECTNKAELSMIEYKENLFQKLINKIREMFILK